MGLDKRFYSFDIKHLYSFISTYMLLLLLLLFGSFASVRRTCVDLLKGSQSLVQLGTPNP